MIIPGLIPFITACWLTLVLTALFIGVGKYMRRVFFR